MKKLLLVSVAAMSLQACSLLPHYTQLKAVAEQGVDTAIEDRKDFNDKRAQVAVELPCDVPLGAIFRIADTRKRAILIELCGGPPANSQISVDELAGLLKVMQQTPTQ